MQLPGWRICRALHSDRACSADGLTPKNDATDTTTAIFGNSLIENTGITHLSWGEPNTFESIQGSASTALALAFPCTLCGRCSRSCALRKENVGLDRVLGPHLR